MLKFVEKKFKFTRKNNSENVVEKQEDLRREREDIYEVKEPKIQDLPTGSVNSASILPYHSLSSITHHPIVPAQLVTITSKLKDLYKAQDVLPKLIEDSSLPDQRMDDYYVKLQIMLKDKSRSGEKQPIDLNHIFDKVGDQEAASKVLITGVAGVGKTTFLNHVSYEWGREKIFNDKFDYVFKIRLKNLLNEDLCNELKKNYSKNDSLIVLIQRCIEQQQIDQIAKYSGAAKDLPDPITLDEIRSADKSKTLLLLDGYDEIEHLNRGTHIVREIISRIFDYPNVVMTTRPNALSSNLDSLFERRIENVGFGDDGIDSYIDKYFTNQSRKLVLDVEECLVKSSKTEDNTRKSKLFQYYEEDIDKRDILIRLEQIDKDRDPNETIKAFKKYIEEYHSSSKENLSKLLSQNLTLKFALATPINAVMTCLVSSDEEIMQRFEGEFNVGTIYEGVIVWLGKRYITKFTPNDTHNLYSDRILNLKILSVFKEVAHNKFAINKTQVSGAELDKLAYKLDTELDIKKVNQFGLLKSEGGKMGFKLELKLYGIPTDSSIKSNELCLYLQDDRLHYAMVGRNGLERGCITEETISEDALNVIKSSLAKKQRNLSEEAEEALLQFVGEKGYVLYSDPKKLAANTLAAKEVRDLIHRDHTFIHLSFQEYLNAYKLKEKLLDNETAKEAAILIATHRNEPKYLMTLKFLSGLVSNEQDQSGSQAGQSNKLVMRFWEAVTCNVDGVLEFGIETKVSMLMHLLNQAKVKGILDSRIPNLSAIKDLIDETVLRDITKWGQQIIDSGYLSEKIVEKLISVIDQNKSHDKNLESALSGRTTEYDTDKGDANDQEEHKKSQEEKGSQLTTTDKDRELKIAIEVITSLISKSEFGGREAIFKQLTFLLNSPSWEIQKLVLDRLAKIIDITINKILLQEISTLIIPFITDINLGNYATNVLIEIILVTPNAASNALKYLSTVLNNDKASDDLKDAAEASMHEIIKVMPPAEALYSMKAILNSKEAINFFKEVATKSIYIIFKAMMATEAFNIIKDILDSEETNKYLKKAAIQSFPDIVKVLPACASEAFNAITIILDNNEADSHLMKTAAEESLFTIVSVLPVAVSLKALKVILNNKEASRNLQEAAAKSLSKLVKAVPVREVFDELKLILDNEEASECLKAAAIESLPEILKSIPSKAIAALKTMKDILADNQADYYLKEVVIENLHGIFKVMPVEKAFNVVKAILNDKNVSRIYTELVKSKFGETIEAMTVLESFNLTKSILNDIKGKNDLVYDFNKFDYGYDLNDFVYDLIKSALDSHLTEIVKTMPSHILDVLDMVKFILNNEQMKCFWEKAILIPSEIVKTMPACAADIFTILKAVLNIEGDWLYINLKQEAIKALLEIVKAEPSYSSKVLESLRIILGSESYIRKYVLNILPEIIQSISSSSLDVFNMIKNILNDKQTSEDFRIPALNTLFEIIKANTSIAAEALDIINTILDDKKASEELKGISLKTLSEIAKAMPSSAAKAFSRIKTILESTNSDNHIQPIALHSLGKIAQAMPSYVPDALKTLISILEMSYEHSSVWYAALQAFDKILQAMPPAEAVNLIKTILESDEEKESVKETVLQSLGDIVKVSPLYASVAFDLIKTILENSEEKYSIKRIAIKVFCKKIRKAIPPEEAIDAIKAILKNNELGHELKKEALVSLNKIAQSIPLYSFIVFDIMREVLEDNEEKINLKKVAIDTIAEIVKTMPFDKVANLLNDKIKVIRDLALISISSKLNTEEVKKLDYKQTVTILNIIDASKGDEEKKELVLSAKKALEHIITTIDGVGIEWFNDHFEELIRFSEARSLIKPIYHKVLGTGKIEDIENEFILNCITKLGLTSSVSKNGEITFEGIKYSINIESNRLEEIIRELLKHSNDLLAQYYKNHAPLFVNSRSAMPIASIDLQDGGSILDGRVLEDDKWLVSLMHLSDDHKTEPAKVFILLEKANSFGGHYMYKIFINNQGLLKISNKYDVFTGETNIELRKEAFGEMDYNDKAIFGKPTKFKYYGSTIQISLRDGEHLIKSVQNDQNQYSSKDEYVLMRKLLQPFIGNNLGDSETNWQAYSSNLEQVQEFSKAQLFPGLKLDKRDSVIVEQHRSGINIEIKVEKLEYRLDQIDKITEALDKKADMNSVLSDRQKKKLKAEITELGGALKEIKSKMNANEPILKKIITEINDLIGAKDITYELVNDLNERLDDLGKQAISQNPTEACFYVNEIIYDNELLNHPEMFTKLANIYGANKVLDLSSQMSPLALHQAVESGNSELLGLMLSLD